MLRERFELTTTAQGKFIQRSAMVCLANAQLVAACFSSETVSSVRSGVLEPGRRELTESEGIQARRGAVCEDEP
eukprot:1174226-Rhodomonas_salina.1